MFDATQDLTETFSVDLDEMTEFIAKKAKEAGVLLSKDQISFVLHKETDFYSEKGLLLTEEEVEAIVEK